MRANSWMIKQVLATGVHGLLLCHAETPEAVRAFVEAARYSFHRERRLRARRRAPRTRRSESARRRSGESRSTNTSSAPIRGRSTRAASCCSGIKVENTRALANVERTTRVPGLAFAEWGPGDMGMSMGHPDQHDEPYPRRDAGRARRESWPPARSPALAFLEQVTPENVTSRLDQGVMIGCGPQAREAAEIGRKHTGRKLPW